MTDTTSRSGPLAPGTRIRVTDRCAWPERCGCEGVVVGPPQDRRRLVYPWPGVNPGQVVILLDSDPLGFASGGHNPDGWSCVLNADSVEALPDTDDDKADQ